MKQDELAKLTPEQKRIKIAEACGWKTKPDPIVLELIKGFLTKDKDHWCVRPDGELAWTHQIPDYLNDLNAMHEAEKVPLSRVPDLYVENIGRVVARDMSWNLEHSIARADLIHSTAAQRADAFLLTINLP